MTETTMTTKASHELTLRDRLSRLTVLQAEKLLGPDGRWLIQLGGKLTIEIEEQVRLDDRALRVELPGATVTIELDPWRRDRLALDCTSCGKACEHLGAVLSLLLEEKMSLGLAAPPPERVPIESLGEEALVRQAIAERAERARTEEMSIESGAPSTPWADYTVTSKLSGKSYRVALRGLEPGESYCSCPDFRKNTLGTCKHILHVIEKVRRRFSRPVLERPYRPRKVSVHLRYGREVELRVVVPDRLDAGAARIVAPLRGVAIQDAADLVRRVAALERRGEDVVVYPDAQEYIDQLFYRERVRDLVAEIRKDPAAHPLRRSLLKTELLPYQLDGIAFALGAGRAILADDMGLGKTIQGIGFAELLAREAGASRILIVCPASLKSQWLEEVRRFSDRECRLVTGGAAARARQYADPSFFTVCNYEQVLRDILHIEQVKWDAIILDEAQRIKNWESRTSRIIKGLRSRFALVLTGTPIENRLEDLYTIMGFVDDRRFGPAFRFFNTHRVVDEKGRVLGYKNLDLLRRTLSPILLRRTRDSVMRQLPERTTEIRRVPPTDEQFDLDAAQMRIVANIVRKPYLTEMDLFRLRKALLLARMSADSTFLVNKEEPGYSSKLEELGKLLEQLVQEDGRKIVLFSEWTTMLGLIEQKILRKLGARYVRLDGSVPQGKRQALVNEFQKDPSCRLFITTNAGSTGLNLQAANTVVNVDLPWNPAVLEQRVARAHRMGQKRPVNVFVLVTEGTIEEKLLTTLSAKHQVAQAALDPESEVSAVDLTGGIEELKKRLETLLGAQAEAPVDETERARAREESERLARKDRVSVAGGQLLVAAFGFLGELVPAGAETDRSRETAARLRERFEDCLERGSDGKLRLNVTLPDESALDGLARSLAAILDREPERERRVATAPAVSPRPRGAEPRRAAAVAKRRSSPLLS